MSEIKPAAELIEVLLADAARWNVIGHLLPDLRDRLTAIADAARQEGRADAIADDPLAIAEWSQRVEAASSAVAVLRDLLELGLSPIGQGRSLHLDHRAWREEARRILASPDSGTEAAAETRE